MIPRSIALEGRLQGNLRTVTLNGHLHYQVTVVVKPVFKGPEGSGAGGSGSGGDFDGEDLSYMVAPKRLIKRSKIVPAKGFDQAAVVAQLLQEDEELLAILVATIEVNNNGNT